MCKDLNLVRVRPLIIRLLYKILKVLLSSRTHTRCWNFFFLIKRSSNVIRLRIIERSNLVKKIQSR